MAPLWFNLLQRQRQLSFGLTLPFLIGATRSPVGTITGSEDADFSDLCRLLEDFRAKTPSSSYVGIAKCTMLGEPVAAFYDQDHALDDLERIVVAGRPGSLYASSDYQTGQSMDSLAEMLWDLVGHHISAGDFSFVEGAYTRFAVDDFAFIESAQSKARSTRGA